MRTAFLLLVVTALIASLPAEAIARTWTNKAGTSSVEADFVVVQGEVVVLRKRDKTTIKIPVAKLSAADQEFLKTATAEPEPKASVAASSDAKLILAKLTIVKDLGEKPANTADVNAYTANPLGLPGLQLVFRVPDEKRELIELDPNACEIAAFTDDKGGDLLQSGDGPSVLPFAFFRADEHTPWGQFEINHSRLPTRGATKIHLKGVAAMLRGTGNATDEQKGVELKASSVIQAGPTPLTISSVQPQEFGESKMAITLSSNKPLAMVKKITFVNAAGKEIPTQSLGSMAGGIENEMIYEQTIGLAEAVEKVDVRISRYETLETVKIPFEVDVSVGF